MGEEEYHTIYFSGDARTRSQKTLGQPVTASVHTCDVPFGKFRMKFEFSDRQTSCINEVYEMHFSRYVSTVTKNHPLSSAAGGWGQ